MRSFFEESSSEEEEHIHYDMRSDWLVPDASANGGITTTDEWWNCSFSSVVNEVQVEAHDEYASTPWAHLYRDRLFTQEADPATKKQAIEVSTVVEPPQHKIHPELACEFKKFQWTYFDFARSKKRMSHNFHPLYGRLRKILTVEGTFLNNLYAANEESGDLATVETTIYSKLWASPNWEPYLMEQTAEIFEKSDVLPLSVWAFCMCQHTVFIAICRHLDCRTIRTLAQVCSVILRSYRETKTTREQLVSCRLQALRACLQELHSRIKTIFFLFFQRWKRTSRSSKMLCLHT